MSENSQDPIAHIESSVRGYARQFPAVFDRAVGSLLYDQSGKRYIDFFCGAGTLNYGHNNARAKNALLRYIESDGIQHSLDKVTTAKVRFVDAFQRDILIPRGMDYKIQFTGPTGTNAVEAAIKLARKAKERSHIIAFTHAYHGHSLGALSLTANQYYHSEYYGSANNVSHLPYDGYMAGVDTSELLEKMIRDSSSGVPLPAAIILETVQGEGGINVASESWLRKVEAVCRKYEILLIVDDIQVGNGRTGDFFSFEAANIQPDIICLSKSLGGGLPLSVVLMKPEWDQWSPGQHTGTFRGNNLAFVAATEVLSYWTEVDFVEGIRERSSIVERRLRGLAARFPQAGFEVRGRGMIWGLDVREGKLAKQIIQQAFADGMILEASGADDEVLKVMAALNIDLDVLQEGLSVLEAAVERIMTKETPSIPNLEFPSVNPLNSTNWSNQ